MKNLYTIFQFKFVYAALIIISIPSAIFSQWKVVPSPNPGSSYNSLEAVKEISGTVWAVGNYSDSSITKTRTLILRYNGTAWDHIPSPSPSIKNAILNDIDGVSSNDIWAVGSYTGVSNHQFMIIMRWNGTSWSMASFPNLVGAELNAVTAISADNVWAVGFKTVGAPGPLVGTLVMHWDGSTWSEIPSPNISQNRHNELNDVAHVSGNDIWSVGHYRIFTQPFRALSQHWDGSSWSNVNVPEIGLQTILYGMTVISPNNIWATGKYQDDAGTRPLFMRWDGSDWDQVDAPFAGFANYGITSFGSNDIYAVGDSIMHYNGSVWEYQQMPVTTHAWLKDITNASNDLWAVGNHNPEPFVNKTLILRNSSRLTNVSGEPVTIEKFSLNQNYPNPFNPSTTITFDLPQQSHTSLIVYDLIGREITRLVNNELRQAGTYSVSFNAKDLSSGVYIYKLQAGNFTETKRMMLVK